MPDDIARPNLPPVPEDKLNQIVSPVVLRAINKDPGALRNVIILIDPNVKEPGKVHRTVEAMVKEAIKYGDRTEQNITSPSGRADVYTIYGRLQGTVIKALVSLDLMSGSPVIVGIQPDIDGGKIFNPDNLLRSVISVPMLRQIEADDSEPQAVLIEININYAGGRTAAKQRIIDLVARAIAEAGDPPGATTTQQGVSIWKSETSQQYVYARLQGKVIQQLASLDAEEPSPTGKNAIYHIWPDFKIRAQVWKSIATVKADASRRAFATTGSGIVWAVLDSGIDGLHPQFVKYKNLELSSGLTHLDFTQPQITPLASKDLTDDYGHGTHVAGIIAGELDADKYAAVSLCRQKDPQGVISYSREIVREDIPIMGIAPECKLVSYKVLDQAGEGDVSTVIAAIQKIQEINGYGRQIVIHGVNMSLGYDFDPEWFACGQSPICVEVDRLVRSGVSVVIAAGNTGKGFALTINDPGNAELALTVGATHRDMPHRYGVSYFSSKGPTGDGRRKPDLLAPGERIISCGAGTDLQTYLKKTKDLGIPAGKTAAYYLERSGTSMAAPHVSGIIAGLLSVRGEYIGLPEDLKKKLIANAIDLGREPGFQGGGLVDMMRTIQAF
ncbi:MAG: serine protease AprX [Bryobacterales bacterium]|nr:serine protease AprX [Bryobacterales bacterium]